MKTLALPTLLAAALACFTIATSNAQDENRRAQTDRTDRLERLERRLNEIAERQEQFMNRVGGELRRREGQDSPAPNPPMNNPRLQRPARFAAEPMAQPNPPISNRDIAQHWKPLHDFLGTLFLVGIICNILLAIWIYTDIRKRNEGSGIFVAMALVAGIPAALIYSVTRIGDKKP